jgi:addiction module RelB/DinJ family antitoxin
MDAVINIRTNKKTRDQAKKIFAQLGLTTSAGINLFLQQVIAEKGIPFTPTRDPRKIRAEWDKEVAEAIRSGKSYTAKNYLEGLI